MSLILPTGLKKIDISNLLRIEVIGYQWSIAKSNTGHYICRIWQDKVIDKRYTRTLYIGKFGNNLQDVIDECWCAFKDESRV